MVMGPLLYATPDWGSQGHGIHARAVMSAGLVAHVRGTRDGSRDGPPLPPSPRIIGSSSIATVNGEMMHDVLQ